MLTWQQSRSVNERKSPSLREALIIIGKIFALP
jgi:hypothetical protein